MEMIWNMMILFQMQQTFLLDLVLTLGLFDRRVIVVTCICPSVHLFVCLSFRLSVCLYVCLSVPIILVNTITQSVYPINPQNLQGDFDMALSWVVL